MPNDSFVDRPNEDAGEDPIGTPEELAARPVPEGVDRRAFLMRSALISATAVLTGRAVSAQDSANRLKEGYPPTPPLSPSLYVVKEQKGPVMTVLDEFYKVGPGPSSSHTIGPMRITYDFYQRCTKLPAGQLSQATAFEVHLFGSLSATGKGHGTERASLAGLVGKEPATVDPAFLDSLRDQAGSVVCGQARPQDGECHAEGRHLRCYGRRLPAPQYDDLQADGRTEGAARTGVLLSGGRIHRVEGYTPPKKNQPKYPFATMKELRQHAEQNNLSIADVILANEMTIPGSSSDEVYAFIDKITNAMVAIVKSGLSAPEDVLPGPIKLPSKAATVYKRAQDDPFQSDRGIGTLAAYALAGSEENARGHLVVTAPTGGSAGVLPALVYGLGEGGRKLTAGPDPQRHACGRRDRLSVQAQCDALGRRGRLPSRDRRRVRHGCRPDRGGIRRHTPSSRECRGIGPGASPWA